MSYYEILNLSGKLIKEVDKFLRVKSFKKRSRLPVRSQIQCLRTWERYHFNPEFIAPFYTAFEKNKIRGFRNSLGTQSRIENAGAAEYIH
ncbi:MAG: hypothetical protein ABSE07_05255 [Methanoregula sp.]|jgi:hypothetical protein